MGVVDESLRRGWDGTHCRINAVWQHRSYQGRTAQLPRRPLTDPGVRFSRTGLFGTARFALTRSELAVSHNKLVAFCDTWCWNPILAEEFIEPLPHIAPSVASPIQPFE